ncbi:MAG: phosphoribosylamine--glycine ligase, partial [Myxococcota bacterium]
MNVLVVGGGGREHALCWALRRSDRVGTLYVAPGNGGTAGIEGTEAIAVSGTAEIVEAAKRLGVGLVVVGPEVPLAEGLADRLLEAQIPCFGPSKAGAQL